MQAIMVSEPGGPEVLRVGETDIPRPDRGEVLVRVLAAGVGPWDAYLRRSGWSGPWPYIPGAEFAGLVEGHSGDEAGFHDGEPVYGYPSHPGRAGPHSPAGTTGRTPRPRTARLRRATPAASWS